MRLRGYWAGLAAMLLSPSALAADAAPAPASMTIDRIETIVRRIDAKAARENNSLRFKVGERELLIVSDPAADRMRAMVPIAKVADLPAGIALRMLQANFDSALDARYAVANELVWGVFIHPLGSLTEADLLSGIGQTVNVAQSFGATYSSGAFVYGGGDSQGIQLRELLDELRKLEEDAAKTHT